MQNFKPLYAVGTVAVLLTIAATRVAAKPHVVSNSTASLADDLQKNKTPGDLPDRVNPKAGPCVVLASDLIGMKVVSAENENLGKIEDLVVQPGGEIAYGVLSFGGVMGLGDKLFAIPWSVLHSKGFDATAETARPWRS